MKPNFFQEKKLWRRGYNLVIGIDEVGRGAFAGPVVVGAVVFSNQLSVVSSQLAVNNIRLDRRLQELGVNDSKLVSPQKRTVLAKDIKKYALCWTVAEIGVSTINKKGIGKATEMAMRKAIKTIKSQSFDSFDYAQDKFAQDKKLKIKNIGTLHKTFLLVDAFHVKYCAGIGLKNQKAIVHGDRISLSIAAASIVAKVFRDQLMTKLSTKHKKYRWEKNKGYGTTDHRKAIELHGTTKHHRTVFIKTWREKLTVS